MIYFTTLDTPIQQILLTSDGRSLTGLYMSDQKHCPAMNPVWIQQDDVQPFPQAKQQLIDYFAGDRTEFELPLSMPGTAFQQRVWDCLQTIPYGTTVSYGELARQIGQPNSSRAVGLANGRNPISIIVPCHRVIGANGRLTGYGGGIDRKQWLLQHEQLRLMRSVSAI